MHEVQRNALKLLQFHFRHRMEMVAKDRSQFTGSVAVRRLQCAIVYLPSTAQNPHV